MSKLIGRGFISEAIGVFTLVFIGVGAIIVNQRTHEIGNFGIALAFGLSVTLIISSISKVSGAHLNPIVTLSLCATGKCSSKCAFYYMIAQVIGASIASATLYFLFGDLLQFGVTVVSKDLKLVDGFVIELIMSFFLVLTVLHTSNAFIIGIIVFLNAFIGGSLTGASMNPARSFGPAMISNHWDYQWLYWLAPLTGASLAIIVYYFNIRKTSQ
ncbi:MULTISPECIES: MIP/aquaporin family protein [Serratia]|uniref:MIP/aquaporin family protein n=1 Tax=Serratia TaxID=613 RepID=UPI0021C93495|nr:aquaporin [Serratia liquefaciens]EKN4905956.1 aquaporin [Yersinia enterocolitica]HDM8374021.1 aquaporin [Yersinia enterocolitica]HEN3244217.1 aquaporin [Yersinia enterocolitica]HEN3450930.1 aquaporin [Yersinia enterocolitica]HEN5458078.1 aquaporin [Yersinia enterocolitica]